jgi:lactate dehydrogenase-like 2-hydroxyacid dehydrogenase
MSAAYPKALQLCPFSDYFEAALRKRLGVVRWYEFGAQEQASWLQRHASEARAVITGGHLGCTNALMDALPALGIVAINGVGVDKVDLAHAKDRGVRVSSTPGVPTQDVADLAVGLIISLLRAIPQGDAHVRGGGWEHGDRPLGRKVTGRRFGIVGFGQIGQAIAARLAVFGPIAYTSPRRKDVPYEYHADLIKLARECDVLVLACTANATTRKLIDARVLEALGPEGYLINVARGSVVDEAALITALESGGLAGAALDVFEDEPRVPAALCASPKVVLTPHIASATVESRTRMADVLLKDLDAFLDSKV